MEVLTKETRIKVKSQSIYPLIEILLTFQIKNKSESIIFQGGFLKTQDNFIIAPIYQFENSTSLDVVLLTRQERNKLESANENHKEYFLRFFVILNEYSTNHIEKNRLSNTKHDVEFIIELEFQKIETIDDSINQIRMVSNTDLLPVIFRTKIERCQTSHTIPASRWLQEFCEPLNIGKFILVELKLPEANPQTDFLKESLKRSNDNIKRVLSYFNQGDWYGSIETARKIFEIFKFKNNQTPDIKRKNELKKIFFEVNLSDKGFDDLYNSFYNLFNFISKFEHEKGDNGEFLQKPVPQKEDAYYVYLMCIGIINLISNKIK